MGNEPLQTGHIANLPCLPKDWRWMRLDELIDDERGICYGIVQPGENDPDGVPMVNTQDVHNGVVNTRIGFKVAQQLHDRFRRSQICGGEVLVTLVGANFGRVAVAPEAYKGFNCSRAVGVIPVKEDAQFVSYALRSPVAQHFMQTWANTTAQPTLNLKEVATLPVPLPPLSEQRAVAAVLGALDNKIELNRQMNETLEALAQSLFKSWFVDTTQSSRPHGWRENKLGELLSAIETGGRPKGGVGGITEGVPSVGAESIVGLGHFDFDKTKFVPREFFNAMNKGHVQDGDVLLYKDGGRPGQFEPHVTMVGDEFPFPEFSINEHVYRLRTEPNLPQSFLYFWLSSDSAMEEMRRRGTGVAIPGLNSTQVRELAVPCPPPDLLHKFDETVSPLIRKIFANCKESRTLAALRDALLPKLLSGELRVPAAAQLVEARE